MRREITLLALIATFGCGEVFQDSNQDAGPSINRDGSLVANPDANDVPDPPEVDAGIPTGGLNQPCDDGNTCDPGLECDAEICIDPNACSEKTLVYLNFNGGTFRNATQDNAIRNETDVMRGITPITVPGSRLKPQQQEEIVAKMTDTLKPFHLELVTFEPRIDHYEIVFTESKSYEFSIFEGLSEVASFGCKNEQRIAFVITEDLNLETGMFTHFALKALGLSVGGSKVEYDDSIMSAEPTGSALIPEDSYKCYRPNNIGLADCNCPGSNEEPISSESIFDRFELAFGLSCTEG